MTAQRSAWRLALTAVAVLVQFWVLYVPKVQGPDSGLPLDKVGHFLIFFVATALALWSRLPRLPVLVLMVGQAVVSEIVQGLFMPNRSGDLWDVVADLAGVALAALLVRQPRGTSHT